MNRIRNIRRLACILAGLACSLVACITLSPAALAYRLPPSGSGGAPPLVQTRTHAIVTGGTPGWQIALIAIGAAIFAAALAVTLDRVRTAHRQVTASGA